MFMPSDPEYRWSETIIREACYHKELLDLKTGDIITGVLAGANPKHFSYLVLEDRKPESLFISVLDIEENIKTKINVCWDVYHLGQIEKILSL